MNGALQLSDKALPSLVVNDDLPPLPPPKLIQGDIVDKSSLSSLKIPSPQLENTLNLSPSQQGFPSLLAPISPLPSPGPSSSSPSPDGRPKKSNPLTDLIDTEKLYVDQLAGIIRKVASAWSRSNLPPSELDIMFRATESIYKANRGLLAKLKEIGTSPSSPKALGDLLMRWIDDLEGPYTTYATKFLSGFDDWEAVTRNSRLPTTIALFSSANPPPTTSANPHPSQPPLWTLDSLFLLPHGRLKYYKKLYGRLLKSTSPGRSDHKLLVGALGKLDKLLATVEARANVKVSSQAVLPAPAVAAVDTEDEVVVDMRTQHDSLPPPPNDAKESSSSDSGSTSRHASSSNSDRHSQDTVPTTDRGSTSTLSSPIADLERRLSTDRTLDLFSMKPRDVKLQIVSPGLTYTRELRISVDVTIQFTPKSTGEELIYQRGHIFLLTDLFLICERMLPSERAKYGPDGPEMMVIFPPLAGKHLRVSEVPNSDLALSVTVLRKETMILKVPSANLRRKLLEEFRDCIDFAASLHSRATQPPPMPSLNNIPHSISSPFPSSPSSRTDNQRSPGSSNRFSPPAGASSPETNHFPDDRRFSPIQHLGFDASSRRWSPSARPGDSINKLVLSPDVQVQQVTQRVPSLQDPVPGSLFPPRTSSTAETILDPMNERRGSGGPQSAFPNGQGGPLGPGQVVQSFQPGQTITPSFIPGQIVTSQSFSPGQIVPPARNISLSSQSRGDPAGPPRGPGPPPAVQSGPFPPARNMSMSSQGHGDPPPAVQSGPFPPARNMSMSSQSRGDPPGPPHAVQSGPFPPAKNTSMGSQSRGNPPGPPPAQSGSFPPSRNTSMSSQGLNDPPGPPRAPPPGPPNVQSGPHANPNVGLPAHPTQYRSPSHVQYPGPPSSMQGYGPGIPRKDHSYGAPMRPPSEPSMQQNAQPNLRKSISSYSVNSQYERSNPPGQLPFMPPSFSGPSGNPGLAHTDSFGSLHAPQPRPLLPSAQMSVKSMAMSNSMAFQEVSPPSSPVLEKPEGPVTNTISAQMKCKVFLKQQHAQWKSLGAARLKLYREMPTNVKQLVVEGDNKDKSIIISTIVLTDGVERIGKTGVAIELSNKGSRTGVVYMIQLRNEAAAGGLFDSLLAGSDRS